MTATDTVAEALAMAVAELTARERVLNLEAAVTMVVDLLLARGGETITPELADERARNVVQALVGYRIGE